jgi:hypothetical protein
LKSSHIQLEMPTTTHATKVIFIINNQGLASSETQSLSRTTALRKLH